MQEFLGKDFAKILKHNALEARRAMRASDSTVARIYDRSLEGLDVTVDLYGAYARILDYGNPPLEEAEKEEVIDIVHRHVYIENDKIIYKERKKREGREQHEREEESLVVEVKENGHIFKTELLKYIDTGLFLDQAETRKVVEESSFGLRVLNLFSYTGSFSVYAAAGGAESVTSVDLSNVYSQWAEENMDSNGFLDRSKYPIIASDAYKFLIDAMEKKEKWDLIIFDPPSFSNSHKAEDFDLKKDYLFYLYSFTKILKDNGVVIFSENLASFGPEKAKLKPYYKVSEMTDELRAFGFTKKKSTLRIFRLEKVKEFKGEVMRRIQDDESLEHLSLGVEKKERRQRKNDDFKRKERRDGYSSSRECGYSIEKGSFKDRRENRERRNFDDRDRGYQRRGEGFRTRDGKYDESWFDRQSRRFDDRDNYSERRRDDRKFDGRDERRGRFNEDRPRRSYDDRRDYDDRPRRYEDRSDRPRRFQDGEDRPKRRFDSDDRPREKRVRKAPVPYGYDEFRETRTRDDKKNNY